MQMNLLQDQKNKMVTVPVRPADLSLHAWFQPGPISNRFSAASAKFETELHVCWLQSSAHKSCVLPRLALTDLKTSGTLLNFIWNLCRVRVNLMLQSKTSI